MSILTREAAVVAHNYDPLPVVAVKAQGSFVWDEAGKKYLDCIGAYSAVSFGHAHPRILAAMQRQAAQLGVVSRAMFTDKLAPFAERLCKLTHLDRMLPMNTGAEAVETAIKAARKWGYEKKGIAQGRAEIIVSRGNFHGRTSTIVGFSSEPTYKKNFGPFAGGFVEIPFGDAAALEAAITPHTCAFLTEPVLGEGGIVFPPPVWLKAVQAICKKHNVLLVLDEVQSGLARTGKNFAFEHEIDRPDGLILGKALGGGVYPVSAFVATRAVMDVFTPGTHGSTFGGNPIACAIACEALDMLVEEKLAARSATLGAWLVQQFESIKSSLIKNIRGQGLWVGVEIDSAKAHAHDIALKLLDHGVLTKDTHGTVLRFAPPLTSTQEELAHAVVGLRAVCATS